MRYRVYDIDWETDGFDVALPEEMFVYAEDDEGAIAEASDERGWLIKSAKVEPELWVGTRINSSHINKLRDIGCSVLCIGTRAYVERIVVEFINEHNEYLEKEAEVMINDFTSLVSDPDEIFYDDEESFVYQIAPYRDKPISIV
jgi:hypothetical protein